MRNEMRHVKNLATIALLCLALLAQGCDRSETLGEDERALLVTVEDLDPFMKSSHDAARGRFKKTVTPLIDERELSYVFEFNKEANEAPLYLNYTVTIASHAMSASDRAAKEAGFAIGLAIGGGKVKQEKLEGFPQYGDRSSISLLTLEGRPVGNLFTVEYGGKSVVLIMSGLYVRKPEAWREMFGEKLHRLEIYQAQAKG